MPLYRECTCSSLSAYRPSPLLVTNFGQYIRRKQFLVEELTLTFVYSVLRRLDIKHFCTVTNDVHGTSARYLQTPEVIQKSTHDRQRRIKPRIGPSKPPCKLSPKYKFLILKVNNFNKPILLHKTDISSNVGYFSTFGDDI